MNGAVCRCPICGEVVGLRLDRTFRVHPQGVHPDRRCPASRNPAEHDDECAACSDRHPKWTRSHLGYRWLPPPSDAP